MKRALLVAVAQPVFDRARIHVPSDFANALYAALEPGSTLLVTDAPVLPETTGVPIEIVNADPDQADPE